MALLKSKDTIQGFNGDYWRINKIVITPEFTKCEVGFFKSKVAANQGKAPIETLLLHWQDNNNPCTKQALKTNSPYTLCYNKLKTEPVFIDATDDPEVNV